MLRTLLACTGLLLLPGPASGQDAPSAGDKVLFMGHESGRGKASGLPIDQDVFVVFTLRDGLITKWKGYMRKDEAFAAIGVEPPID